MKKIITFYLFIAVLYTATAQSHISTGKYACQLVPSSLGYEKYSCPACAKNREIEKEAKLKESKRREAVSIEKNKANKTANDLASKKKQQDIAEKSKVTEVGVKMPKSSVPSNSPGKKTTVNNTDKTILKVTGNGKGFKNEKDEVLFENDEWSGSYSIENLSLTKTPIKNFGIVDINTGNKGNIFGEFRTDIINSKGEYLFNDDNIKFICHINDGWFLVGSWNSDNYYVYSLNKKLKINFSSLSEYNSESGRMVWGPAIDLFLPIFSDNVELNDNLYSNQLKGKPAKSATLKNQLQKLFPQELNEDFLSKQSFVLVHANFFTTYLADDRNYEFEKSYKATDFLMLYCISKDGKLSTIKLK